MLETEQHIIYIISSAPFCSKDSVISTHISSGHYFIVCILKLKLQFLLYKPGSLERKLFLNCDVQEECQNGSTSAKYSVL